MMHLASTLALRIGPFDFGEPLWLLAFLVLLPIIYFWRTSKVPATPMRRGIALALRCVLVSALVFALAETRLVWSSKGVCVIFVIDQSESIPPEHRIFRREQIQDAISKHMTKDDLFAVIEFGGDSVLSALPSAKGALPPPTKVIDTARTDIARALRLALATFPVDRQKRIVLISDGNQNAGDALREARVASMKDADIETVLVGRSVGHEVMVESVAAPSRVQKEANFVVRVVVSADQAQNATLLIKRDNDNLPPKKVRLKEGTNVFEIPDKLADGGFHHYEVTIQPDNAANDSIRFNNTGYTYTMVEAAGKVLLVRGKVSDGDYISGPLSSRMSLDIVRDDALPNDVRGLMPYDCIILENVPKLAEHKMQSIEKWVKDSGGGLILIAGDDSFGPGGWKDTPLERVSPVEMDVKRKQHIASLAMAIMLDKSGSMGETVGGGKDKMDLANNGAVETLKLLDERDMAAVAAVDTVVKWARPELLPMGNANKRLVSELVLAQRAGGGGILCRTALEHAYTLITGPNVSAMTRHVILFVDTADAEQPDRCVEMARRHFESKPSVTTSVIGLGSLSDKDVPFLRDLAIAGHGRFHITNNPMDLPRIFAKEAFIAHRNAWVEDEKGITLTQYPSPLMEGFERSGVPKIFGYVGTTLKPRATLALHGKEADDPVLAHWSYGLGKVIAYTSDDTARWGKSWVQWDGFEKFWVQAVRWASRNLSNSPFMTTTTIEGAEGRIAVEAAASDGKPINNLQLKATVNSEDPNKPPVQVPLIQVAPGRYQGSFAATERGNYTIGIADAVSGMLVDVNGAVSGYPPEYRDLNPNAGFLNALADASSGQAVTGLDAIFAPKATAVRSYWLLWDLLLILVTCSLLADIAWRRLNIADWFRPRSMPLPGIARRPGETVGAFKTIKSTRAQVAAVQQTAAAQGQTMRERLARKSADPLPQQGATSQIPAAVREQAAAQTAPVAQSDTPQQEAGYASALMRAKRRAADAIKEREER